MMMMIIIMMMMMMQAGMGCQKSGGDRGVFIFKRKIAKEKKF